MLSTVALLQGDTVTAISSASDAITRFRRLGHAHSVALAKYSSMQALVAADPRRVSHLRLARVADELELAGWKVPALEARVMAGRIALERGHRAAARRHLSLASKARRVGPADARARAWLAEAMLRQRRRSTPGCALCAAGRSPASSRTIRPPSVPSSFGPTSVYIVGTFARHGAAHAGRGRRRPRRALWWAERGRASASVPQASRTTGGPGACSANWPTSDRR